MTTEKMNWIDKTIGYFNPAAGLKRSQFRNALEVVRKYDGASLGRRTASWYAPSTSAALEIAGSLPYLRNRMRDLVRNNPHAGKAVRGIVSNTIGTGIVAKLSGKNIQDAWKQWSETTDCDSDGINTLAGLQQLAMRCIVESGEVIIRKRRRNASMDLSVPLQIQILEPDYLDITKDQAYNGTNNAIYQGVEFDKNGKRVAYWLYRQHPGGRIFIESYKLASDRVPVEEIIHIFRQERAGQIRGVPWGASAIIRAKDLDDYFDAQLIRQKIAACFAGFIKDTEVPIDPTGNKSSISERIEPGILEVLPPGKDVSFSSPPGVGGDFKDYATISLRAIGIAFGVPYEVLTSDYSQVNFSSARMSWIEFHREIEQWRWIMFIPAFCDRTYNWFIEAAEIAGIAQKNRTKRPEWSAPRREMIDPVKETAAMQTAVRSGFLPLSEALRQIGFDPDQVFSEYANDNSKLDGLKLVLDSDPRKTNTSGQAQSPVSSVSESEGNNGNGDQSKNSGNQSA